MNALARRVALFGALALSACGGDGSGGDGSGSPPPAVTFAVGGTVTGLSGALTLRNKGGDDLALSSDGAFNFATRLANGESYSVGVASQPASQTCTIANGAGTVNGANITNVAVTCVAQAGLTISSMNPTHGQAGTIVTLSGTGFSTDSSKDDCRLNFKLCRVISATATELSVEVPHNAGSGNFLVEVGQSASAQSPLFTYDLTGVTVSTVAGSEFGFKDDPVGTAAKFAGPSGIALGPAGNLFVADSNNHRIRSIDVKSGAVSTFAGNGTDAIVDGNGQQAEFSTPNGLLSDGLGGLFVTDGNTIRKISATAEVVTTSIAGLSSPAGMDFDDLGNLIVVDRGNSRILRIDASGGGVVTVAGGAAGDLPGDVDGNGSGARFQFPLGIASGGDVFFVADTNNMKIRKVTASGDVTTYTGSTSGVSFHDGPLADARFLFPTGLALDHYGKLFVVDTENERIRMVSGGIVTTLAGQIKPGFADGDGASAQFALPQYIVVESDNSLLISDGANNRIRRIVWD